MFDFWVYVFIVPIFLINLMLALMYLDGRDLKKRLKEKKKKEGPDK